eukprot:gene1120-1676_t
MNRMVDFVNIMIWIGIDRDVCQAEKEFICENFLMRRTKEDVKKSNKDLELPPCKIDIKYIPFESEDEEKLYIDTYTKYRGQLETTNNYIYMLENLLRIRQICIHPKLFYDGMAKKYNDKSTEYTQESTKMTELLKCMQGHQEREKCLIFCQFVEEMTIIAKFLKLNGYQSLRLDGTMSIEERAEAVNIFKRDQNINTFIIQINTGGQGINLQCANRIYIMSPNWNPALEHQAIGRCHRTGQRKPVYVTKFVIASGDTILPYIEENIIKLQEQKTKIVKNLLKDGISSDICEKTYAASLSSKDVLQLFNLYSSRFQGYLKNTNLNILDNE